MRAALQCAWLLTLCVTLTLGQVEGDPVVQTSQGAVRGLRRTVEGGVVEVFYGIPFARPPVGQLRFQPPQQAPAWQGEFLAQTPPHSCLQVEDEMFGRFPGVEMWNPNTNMSEDCLYLNIFRPHGANRTEPLTTMVWVYGGGFYSGTSTLDVYDPASLVTGSDVIVVSFNYRLGPLGFLYLGSARAAGNMGMLDQRLALQWVKDNIGHFGGHSSKVAVFGESAGAASIALHLLSPGSAELFQTAILQSGSPLCHWAVMTSQKALSNARRLALSLNCDVSNPDVIADCLMNADAADVTAKQWNGVTEYLEMPFVPVVDGAFLPDIPSRLLAEGKVNNVTLMAGTVKDESTYFLIYNLAHLGLAGNERPENFRHDLYTVTSPVYRFGQEAAVFEYVTSVLPADRTSNLEVLDEVSSDLSFKCPTLDFARGCRSAGLPVFVFQFQHRLASNPWPAWMGVMHGYEIELVFGLPLKGANYSEADRTVSSLTMELWTTFAKTGNPNNHTQIWPPYTLENEEYLVIDVNVTTSRGLRHRKCAFWRDVMPLLNNVTGTPDSGKPGNCVNTSVVQSAVSLPVIVLSGSLALVLSLCPRVASL